MIQADQYNISLKDIDICSSLKKKLSPKLHYQDILLELKLKHL